MQSPEPCSVFPAFPLPPRASSPILRPPPIPAPCRCLPPRQTSTHVQDHRESESDKPLHRRPWESKSEQPVGGEACLASLRPALPVACRCAARQPHC
eukprot:3174277-Rhodomonas_salina.1